jgi:hypothetical protein
LARSTSYEAPHYAEGSQFVKVTVKLIPLFIYLRFTLSVTLEYNGVNVKIIIELGRTRKIRSYANLKYYPAKFPDVIEDNQEKLPTIDGVRAEIRNHALSYWKPHVISLELTC